MEFITIFETPNQLLSSVVDGETDEFNKVFEQWRDVNYLREFFKSNYKDLSSGYYQIAEIDDAIYRTLNDANLLFEEFRNIAIEAPDAKELNNFFKSLDNYEYREKAHKKCKAYGIIDRSWIRLYAIKLESNSFIVTGGTIKLTRLMSDSSHTQLEFEKLEKCRNYLQSNGIYCNEGLS